MLLRLTSILESTRPDRRPTLPLEPFFVFVFLKLWCSRKSPETERLESESWELFTGGRSVGRSAVGGLQSLTWQESQCSASRWHIPDVSIHAKVKLAARIQLRREFCSHGHSGRRVGRHGAPVAGLVRITTCCQKSPCLNSTGDSVVGLWCVVV